MKTKVIRKFRILKKGQKKQGQISTKSKKLATLTDVIKLILEFSSIVVQLIHLLIN
jgi:hypothetical protein